MLPGNDHERQNRMITRRSLLLAGWAVNLLQYAGCAKNSGGANAASNDAAGGGVHPSVTTRASVGASSLKGENIAGGEYWTANDLFIDLIDNAGYSVTAEFTDPATGDVTLPPGKNWTAILRETSPSSANSHVKLRPGRIRVWWTGTATVAEVGISAPPWAKVADTGKQEMEITVPAEDAQGGGQFALGFQNGSGSTKTLVRPHAVYVDDLAAFNAGEIFDPRHLASYPPDIGVIRVIQTSFVHMLNALDNKLSAELTYEQLVPTASNHFWKHRNYQTAALLAKRLGPDVALWVNANVLMNHAGYLQLAAAIAATGFTGKLILEGGLEFWNYAYPYVMQRVRSYRSENHRGGWQRQWQFRGKACRRLLLRREVDAVVGGIREALPAISIDPRPDRPDCVVRHHVTDVCLPPRWLGLALRRDLRCQLHCGLCGLDQ
jgi:hypothetical protein